MVVSLVAVHTTYVVTTNNPLSLTYVLSIYMHLCSTYLVVTYYCLLPFFSFLSALDLIHVFEKKMDDAQTQILGPAMHAFSMYNKTQNCV
jgi:hypothetical protein